MMSADSTASQPAEEPSMSDPWVSAYLTKQLCMHGGRLPLSEIPQHLSLEPEHLASILREQAQRFPEPQAGTVLAHSAVRLCAPYLRERCQATDCERLHLCRYFILGRCFHRGRRNGNFCKFSHDIHSDVNRPVLKANEIGNLNERELRVLLLLNDPYLLPEVCHDYKGGNKDGSCTKGADGCGRLHVCLFFVRGQCRYYRCNRSHNLLEPNAMRVLKERGLSEEMIENVQLMRVHLCNEARKQPWTEELPRKDKNRDCPHSTLDASRAKAAATTECAQADKSDVQGPVDPSPSSGAACTKHTRVERLSGSHLIDSPPPSSTTTFTTYPVTTPDNGILKTNKTVEQKSVSPPPAPTTAVPTYPATTPRTGILKTDKTDEQNSASPPTPSTRNIETCHPTTPHLRIEPKARKPVRPPSPLPKTVTIQGATTPRTGIVLTDNPDRRASVSPPAPLAADNTTSPAPVPKTGIQLTKKADVGVSPDHDALKRYLRREAITSILDDPISEIYVYDSLSPFTHDEDDDDEDDGASYTAGSMFHQRGLDAAQKYTVKSEIASRAGVPGITKPVISSSGVFSPPPPTKKYNPYKIITTTDESLSVTAPPTWTRLTKQADGGVSGVSSPTSLNAIKRENPGVASNTRQTSELPVKAPAPRISAYRLSFETASARYDPRQTSELPGKAPAPRISEYSPSLETTPATNVPPQDRPKRSPAPKDRGDPNEICIHHIWSFCQNQNSCPQMHFHLPYRWQILKGTVEWEDLPWMEDIEKAYSDPSNTSSGRQDINFAKMTSSYHRVRRLSTASSVTQPPNFCMTTEWVWHWKNEHGAWIEYGKHGGKEKATMVSSDLETIYLADKTSVVPFKAGAQRYQLNFQDMIQSNLVYGTSKEVRRRPRFVSKEDVDKLKESGRTTSPVRQPPSPVQGIPAHWDRTALPDVGYQLVDISKTSTEFKEIEQSFRKTMSKYSIQTLKRIQNITLWNFYQMQMEKMKKESKKDVLVKTLFHGTNVAHLDAICRHNFDWRICGVNGTVFGRGSYFARDASYSHNYCQASSGNKTMFLARVLVGDSVQGHPSYSRPPAKRNNPDYLYDSCVDIENNPSIFVVFEKPQIYPEYIMEYKEDSSCCIS